VTKDKVRSTEEALRLAWDALEDIGDEWGFTSQRTVPKRKEAITAIKEALANEALEKMAENARELGLDYEPAQEPVAWRIRCTDPMRDWVLMYRRPKTEEQFSNMEIQPLYTTPPQRKPLTDEEIMNIAKVSCIGISPQEDTLNFAKVIEAVHGIKGEV